eukprot:CAMPEP_0202958892 /NCGR_PEP_ID=MMETSP1396-20130829/3170_1 /ASSEMBLY_ACC=CAM_ASM_000872 /TAXON_ID= /ORGANISM="Pseudokeronopsis sp., Strain Brazil" /LENGTH=64 /DNA_ID=CAMNT_0049677199 /DNA_START=204 /DNA_END=398 /DNA_ORIENTATION=+
MEYQSSNQRSLKRELDDLKVIYEDLVRKGNELTIDFNGMQRMHYDKQSELEVMKLDCKKKGDLN